MVSGYKRFIHVVSSSNPIRARLPREIVESLTRLYLLFFRVSFFLFVVFLFRPFFVVYRSKRGWWKRSAGNDIISACFPAVNTVLLLSLRRFVTVKWTTFINSLQHSISYWFTPFSCYFPCRNNIPFSDNLYLSFRWIVSLRSEESILRTRIAGRPVSKRSETKYCRVFFK